MSKIKIHSIPLSNKPGERKRMQEMTNSYENRSNSTYKIELINAKFNFINKIRFNYQKSV